MRPFINIFIMILFVGLCSCNSIEPLSLTQVENVQVEDFQSGELTLKFKIKIKNPNFLKFRIKQEHLDLYLNGRELGQAMVKDVIVVRRKSEDFHEFYVKVTPVKMTVAGILGLVGLFKDKPLEISIKGDIRVSSFLYTRRYPVEIKENIDLKELGKSFLN
jgi:LEA14-like dessication related protein